MREKSGEMDMEIHFKDAFRAFSKDDEGGHHLFDFSPLHIDAAIHAIRDIKSFEK